MAFSSKVVAVLLLLSTVALCQASSKGDTVTERILQGFKDVNTRTDSLRVATQKINFFNAPQHGFIVAEGLTAIIDKISHGIEKMDGVTSGPLPDADAVLVVQALTKFVQTHQALLNVVIGKHALLSMVPFFQPIRVSLLSLQAKISTFAYELIVLIPTQRPAAEAQFRSLSVTLTQAQDASRQSVFSSKSAVTYTTTERILQELQNVTAMSDSLRAVTAKINILNAPQHGFIIAQGITGIIAKIAEGTLRVKSVSTGSLADADAVLVVEALTTFVQVHQELLNVVISKPGLLTLVPFLQPIRVALVSLEAVIDTFASDLIDLIPTQKPAADAQFSTLSVTLTQAITTYKQYSSMAVDFKLSPDSYLTYTTTERILQGFQTVTDMSDSLRITVTNINTFNAGQQGPSIAQGFYSIVSKIAEGTTRTERVTDGPLSDDDAVLVVKALTTFVQVHQALLNVVIGKHGILTLVPFFEPIRVALVDLEAVIDSFAYDLIALIPTQKPAADDQFSSLSVTLTQAITTYNQYSSMAVDFKLSPDSYLTYTTTERILQGFQTVTDMSDSLRITVTNINTFNAGQQGPSIAQGFYSIVSKIAEGTTRTERVTDGPLSDDDAVLVVKALTTFVQVHQALLNVVIGKHGILTLVPFFEPIRVALVDLEAVIDSFAYDLIALIPTQKPAADDQFSSLSVTLTQAITTYNQYSSMAVDFKLSPDSYLTYTTTERILQGFQTVTDMSDSLRITVTNINTFNAGQQGPSIAQGFYSIVSKIAEGTTRTERVTDGPLSDDDAVLVVKALTTFVQVHQALLNVVIGKHGILTLVPFFEPIRVALVDLEAVIDSFAYDLIALIPTQKPAADDQFSSLSVTLTQAITTYNQYSSMAVDFKLSPDSYLTYTTTERILQGFQTVTDMSDSLRITVTNINTFNAGQQGPSIAQGFYSIVSKIAEGTTRTERVTDGPLSDDDAVLVVKALTTFVQVHQALLNVVIGKHGILTLVPFFEPIRVALVDLEAVIDSFAYDLIALIPTQKPAADGQFSSLSVTLTQAITTYSPSYPKSVAQY